MNIVWNRDAGKAVAEGEEFVITSEVRNELNGRRKLHDPHEVVNIVTASGQWGQAYMPRPFPKGFWRVTKVTWTTARDYAPVKIETNAHQRVWLWVLDDEHGYERQSENYQEDYGYHLHWSEYSRTTLGCGRVGGDTSRQVLILAKLIEAAWKRGETVTLEVV